MLARILPIADQTVMDAHASEPGQDANGIDGFGAAVAMHLIPRQLWRASHMHPPQFPSHAQTRFRPLSINGYCC